MAAHEKASEADNLTLSRTEELFGAEVTWQPGAVLLRLTSSRLQASMASEKADLDTEVCHARAAECRRLASATDSPPLQIMLDHIAETWLRIAKQLVG